MLGYIVGYLGVDMYIYTYMYVGGVKTDHVHEYMHEVATAPFNEN